MQRVSHTQDEADQELLPEYYEFPKSPWVHPLTLKIFRTDSHLAPVVADVLDDANNATQLRASLKQKSQIAKHKQLLAKERAIHPPPVFIKIERTVNPSSSSSVNSSVTTTIASHTAVPTTTQARRKAQARYLGKSA